MSFYEQISKYYDFIFPVGREAVEFIGQSAGVPPKAILDVACGSGGYTVELSKKGYQLTAVDLEAEMVDKAKEKAHRHGIQADIFQCDMKRLTAGLSAANFSTGGQGFDCIFCIGNSLVHLGTHQEILEVLRQMYQLLQEKGVLVLQTINYDRVIKFHISELPELKDEQAGITFRRKYAYHADTGLIDFNTRLAVGLGEVQEVYENSVPLLPLRSEELRNLLQEAGFTRIGIYGSFTHSGYEEDSYLLVVKAGK